MRTIITTLLMSFLLLSCSDAKVRKYRLEVVAEYPHDTQSYTQGLFFEDGDLYESTGLNGRSTFRKVDLETGRALERLNFDKQYFVEGSVMMDGNLYTSSRSRQRCASSPRRILRATTTRSSGPASPAS